MTFLAAALFLLVLACLGAVVFVLARFTAAGKQDNAAVVSQLQKEMADLRTALKDQSLGLERQVHEHFKENQKFLQTSQQGYAQTVGNLQHKLGELHKATQEMSDIGKDIASLQDILRSPKLRGGLGELMLGELLAQILPPDHFCLQYGFQNGSKVDAVITLGQGMVPVDAKFPLENFRRVIAAEGDEEKSLRKLFASDVKKHIDSIAEKYILPEEGTFEFALMYIPAENIYYETIIKHEGQNESLSEYAMRKKVIPVSPNSFYAYLQAIVRGLKGLRIERSAQLILENLGQLETDFAKCLADFEKVGAHLSNAKSAFDKTEKRFDQIHHKLSAIEKRDAQGLLNDES
ncbi:MAG TPA: DNA recombination protein RmuC [Verrucomicrobiae bacterium]|jgi:DNA recombination protein RmuC|nr:DNA recombination protein RmuC [Verrucomicrobiae bacterium]